MDNTKNYTVRLATRPTAQVEVAVSSGDRAVHVDTGATPRMRTLTFTTTNWATAQTVEAVAAVDADASDERVSISHAATGGDYEGVSAQLFATTLDDDEPAIVVAASALIASGVTEGGEATYTVRLDTEPDSVARVSVAAEGAVSVDLDRNQAGVQPWLRFDAANWNTPRTALVAGAWRTWTRHPARRCCGTRRRARTTGAPRRWTCRSRSRTTTRRRCGRTRRRWRRTRVRRRRTR